MFIVADNTKIQTQSFKIIIGQNHKKKPPKTREKKLKQ